MRSSWTWCRAFTPIPIGLLAERRADLVIVSRQDGRPGITYHPLFRFQMLALVPNNHAYAGKRFLAAKDFASETLVTYPIPDDRLDVVREVLAPAGVDPPRRTTDLTVAILQLVASRRGVAVLPGWAVEPYLARGYVTGRPIGPQGLWSNLLGRHHHPGRPARLHPRLRRDHAQGELRPAPGAAAVSSPAIQVRNPDQSEPADAASQTSPSPI